MPEYPLDRQWKTYRVHLKDHNVPVYKKDDVVDVTLGSRVASEWEEKGYHSSIGRPDPEDVIYWGFEQEEKTELNGRYGPAFSGRLSEEWRGHPKDALVFGVFSHVEQGEITVLVHMGGGEMEVVQSRETNFREATFTVEGLESFKSAYEAAETLAEADEEDCTVRVDAFTSTAFELEGDLLLEAESVQIDAPGDGEFADVHGYISPVLIVGETDGEDLRLDLTSVEHFTIKVFSFNDS